VGRSERSYLPPGQQQHPRAAAALLYDARAAAALFPIPAAALLAFERLRQQSLLSAAGRAAFAARCTQNLLQNEGAPLGAPGGAPGGGPQGGPLAAVAAKVCSLKETLENACVAPQQELELAAGTVSFLAKSLGADSCSSKPGAPAGPLGSPLGFFAPADHLGAPRGFLGAPEGILGVPGGPLGAPWGPPGGTGGPWGPLAWYLREVCGAHPAQCAQALEIVRDLGALAGAHKGAPLPEGGPPLFLKSVGLPLLQNPNKLTANEKEQQMARVLLLVGDRKGVAAAAAVLLAAGCAGPPSPQQQQQQQQQQRRQRQQQQNSPSCSCPSREAPAEYKSTFLSTAAAKKETKKRQKS
ncbi:hypothetical protein, conserved, partial [Eimeria tenella]